MATNPSAATSANSPCCPSGASVASESHSQQTNGAANMNTTIGDGHLQATVTSTTTPTVCTLTSPYESRIISAYPRLNGLYGSSYSDQHSFYAPGANPFYSSL